MSLTRNVYAFPFVFFSSLLSFFFSWRNEMITELIFAVSSRKFDNYLDYDSIRAIVPRAASSSSEQCSVFKVIRMMRMLIVDK